MDKEGWDKRPARHFMQLPGKLKKWFNRSVIGCVFSIVRFRLSCFLLFCCFSIFIWQRLHVVPFLCLGQVSANEKENI